MWGKKKKKERCYDGVKREESTADAVRNLTNLSINAAFLLGTFTIFMFFCSFFFLADDHADDLGKLELR